MDNEDVATLGLSAYQSGDYVMAVELLAALTKEEPKRWNCRLYLAMAYSKVKLTKEAMQELRTITDFCTDREIREKALLVLRAMNSQSQQQMQSLSAKNQKSGKPT